MLNTVPVIHQIEIKPTILNTNVVGLSNSDSSFDPIAPLVTVKYSDHHKTKVLFRVIVFVDSDFKKEPIFGVGTDLKNLSFYVFYNAKEGLPVKSYTAWYFEAEYITNDVVIENDTITVFNFNTDPRTSRGTTTSVGSSVGDPG